MEAVEVVRRTSPKPLGRLSAAPWVVGLIVGLVTLAVTIPLALTAIMSLKPGLLTAPGEFTLSFYASAFGKSATYQSIVNSLIYAAGSTAVALFFGSPLAWIAQRTDFRFRQLIFPLITVKILVPVFITAFAWIFLLSPNIGLINQLVMSLFGLKEAPFSIYNLAGMCLVQGLSLASVAFFMVLGVFRRMDASLEEAAYASGIGKVKTFVRINLPLALPGVLGAAAYIFMIGMGTFEVPFLIGGPTNIHVLATLAYYAISPDVGLPNYNLAGAYGSALLILGLGLSYLYSRAMQDSSKYAVVTGRGYKTSPVRLGKMTPFVGGFVAFYFLLALILPFLVLLWVSVHSYVQPFSLEGLSTMSFSAYDRLRTAVGMRPIINTAILMVTAPAVVVLLAFGVSFIVTRTRFRWRPVLDTIAFLPHAIPGVLAAVAFGFLFLSLVKWVPLYGSIWSLVIVMAVARLPFCTRAFNATMVQIHPELDEAGKACGIPQGRMIGRVLVPLLLPTITSTWVWIALMDYREVTAPLVLSSPQNVVVATAVWRLWTTAQFPEASALGVVVISSLLVLFLVARRLTKNLGPAG